MSDDLLPLLSIPVAPGPSQDVRWRQGTVVTFDQVTLSNTVDIGGTTLTDLPILGVAEAASLEPGSVVGLLAIESTLGTVTYAILGRLVTPATAAATQALSLLSQKIYTATVHTNEGTSSPPYVDLATVGPSVDVPISATGRALVFLSASMAMPNKGGAMGFAVSGATTRAADTALTESLVLAGLGTGVTVAAFVTRLIEVSGLNPGINTFTAKYGQTTGSTPQFQDRNITVFAL